MSAVFSTEEKILLDLLAEELQGKKDIQQRQKIDWNMLFSQAEKHSVLSLLYNRIETSDLQEGQKKRWISRCRSVVLQNYHMLFSAKYIIRYLEEHHIPCALLKGASIAECFPVPELRKSGDIDILVLGKENKKRAETLLAERGFTKSKEQHASHHTVWFTTEGLEVEVHTRLSESFNNEAANKKIESLLNNLSGQIQRKELMGVEFPVLTDGYQAYHLLLHMLTHYLHAGFGLRLLCDWVVFWNREVAEADCAEYRRLVAESGLQVFSDMITGVCVHFLGLKPPHTGELVPLEQAEIFMKEVLDAEEFGSSTSDRLVVLHGTGIWDYVKEFHHQMKMNYPKCGKFWILWPVLWIVTLVRFIVNNHKLRKTNSWKVLKKTHERSQRIKELQLFQISENDRKKG